MRTLADFNNIAFGNPLDRGPAVTVMGIAAKLIGQKRRWIICDFVDEF